MKLNFVYEIISLNSHSVITFGLNFTAKVIRFEVGVTTNFEVKIDDIKDFIGTIAEKAKEAIIDEFPKAVCVLSPLTVLLCNCNFADKATYT